MSLKNTARDYHKWIDPIPGEYQKIHKIFELILPFFNMLYTGTLITLVNTVKVYNALLIITPCCIATFQTLENVIENKTA